MVKFIRLTKTDLRKREVLENRIKFGSRMISDVDGRTRLSGHKQIDKAQKDLRKLNDMIHKRKK